jgi:chemotaxis protein methyltransferase WspC
MKKIGLEDVNAYGRLVQSSGSEWNELIEAVVITETCFFREREPFSAFVSLACKEWLPTHPTGRMRILSLPCASGEEPFSAAMALLDAGFPAERFQIDGIDISRRALERAATGVYRKNSFRGADLSFRDRHFSKAKDSYLLNPSLRQNVRFNHGNLLGTDFPGEADRYDFVFCRNLLIYFDPSAQEKAFAKLRRLLTPAGVLFVGPAEIPLALEMGFVSVDIPMAFACRHTRRERTPSAVQLRAWPGLPLTPARRSPLSGSEPASRNGARTSRPTPLDLVIAGRLADEGKLKEAAEICHAHLRLHKDSARAYYLLGLVHDAASQPEASNYYHKALYLEPDHYETLWQLALLAQKDGDFTRAHALKLRARRARNRKPVEL